MSSVAILLGLCQFFFMAAAAVSITFSGLVGERLAGTLALATLPFLVMTGTTALLALALPRLFIRWGYRAVFIGGCLAGVAGGLLAAWAIAKTSFPVFCLAGILLGAYQASALYYRFAAADAMPAAAKGRAVAWVLSGGIPAAFLGPLLGAQMLNLLPVAYMGSYLAAALLALLALPLLMLTRLPKGQRTPIPVHRSPISFLAMLRYPNATAAVVFCAGGYGVMMLVMLATPLAMSAHDHTAGDAASVIQWHLLGMFAPSLLTGKLIDRWQAWPVSITGCIILAMGCGLALLGNGLVVLHTALLLVGIGWNLMYMGGTTLLTQITDDHLRPRLQALNECVTFVVMTLAAGVTGWLYQGLGWQTLLIVAGVLVSIMALAGATWLRACASTSEKPFA